MLHLQALGAASKSPCASCRLRAAIGIQQFARRRRARLGHGEGAGLAQVVGGWQGRRGISGVRVSREARRRFSANASMSNSTSSATGPGDMESAPLKKEDNSERSAEANEISDSRPQEETATPVSAGVNGEKSPEDAALEARRTYGDALPDEHLSEEQYRVYERLYGTPLRLEDQQEILVDVDEGLQGEEELNTSTGVLREGKGGVLEEIQFDSEEMEIEENEDVLTKYMANEDVDAVPGDLEGDGPDAQLVEDMRLVFEQPDDLGGEMEDGEIDVTTRVHPLTNMNRFRTSPTTLQLPKHSLVDPITFLLSGMPTVHLGEAAHRVFGGMGLPYSASTPALAKSKQPKPIALDAAQGRMSEIEGDSYLAVLYPAVCASVTSVLIETRKRLGTAWAEGLVKKAQAGELKILDAGGGGAGVLAVRWMLQAEWERMHHNSSDSASAMGIAEPDGRLGGSGLSAPTGHATVLTASDVLRHRASQLLENTIFVPRLPDYLHAESAKEKGKFDIIIAPHTLWPIKEDYLRRHHAQNLWSLLNNNGGVMCMLEKGVARGFELVAAAREMLLSTRIASPESEYRSVDINESKLEVEWEDGTTEPLTKRKDKGMIIAPCTNHETCPMYTRRGQVKGRYDICHFSQRYIRPSFLQKILGAKDKNHEDVKFSYLAVMRGKDLREPNVLATTASEQNGVEQGPQATERAFDGYEEDTDAEVGHDTTPAHIPHSLSLPRQVLPPLKRRGHVILDLCTPSGTLERWTVPRSFSKQAFRDARKSSWGDLWALGAKTRVPRSTRIGRPEDAGGDGGGDYLDVMGRVTGGNAAEEKRARAGQVRGGKMKGIRDKRDKKGNGRGRRKAVEEEM